MAVGPNFAAAALTAAHAGVPDPNVATYNIALPINITEFKEIFNISDLHEWESKAHAPIPQLTNPFFLQSL